MGRTDIPVVSVDKKGKLVSGELNTGEGGLIIPNHVLEMFAEDDGPRTAVNIGGEFIIPVENALENLEFETNSDLALYYEVMNEHYTNLVKNIDTLPIDEAIKEFWEINDGLEFLQTVSRQGRGYARKIPNIVLAENFLKFIPPKLEKLHTDIADAILTNPELTGLSCPLSEKPKYYNEEVAEEIVGRCDEFNKKYLEKTVEIMESESPRFIRFVKVFFHSIKTQRRLNKTLRPIEQ